MLAQNVQWKVRRTLAASIHEIANILGEQMASEELVDIFNDFLNVSILHFSISEFNIVKCFFNRSSYSDSNSF